MEDMQAEIAVIRAQINQLRREGAALAVNIKSSEDDSPQAIAEAYRRQARENPQLFAELKGIDQAIVALEAQLTNYLAQSQSRRGYITRLPQQKEELEKARTKAKNHAERINQLASELATEVNSLKACADILTPLYWRIYYKPFITGFKTVSVPYVRSDEDVWNIVNRIV
ncbi:hypothetical protein IQ247_07135 [Plectonema cf. radiosum LEGE 06105]|uniref:Uncharacterized protein n=1 Tax=Plectonema cf. radiosum LEGE 06105 TaxID=945769 RepID=A0A8J7EZ11_9CYAN|nr:hypothetical protein [Plectonema radiosum]MBE9212488.1 hypothetical protein [Plectonema cf. radiosum LEGE 06105]